MSAHKVFLIGGHYNGVEMEVEHLVDVIKFFIPDGPLNPSLQYDLPSGDTIKLKELAYFKSKDIPGTYIFAE